MLKILQARVQQYVKREFADAQSGFRKGRGTSNQITNICWIIEKARDFQKIVHFCFIDYTKTFDCVHHSKLWKRNGDTRAPNLPSVKPVCRSINNS